MSDIGIDTTNNLGYILASYVDEFLANSALQRDKYYIYSFSTYLSCEGPDCVKIILAPTPPPRTSGAFKICVSLLALVGGWMLLM